MDARVEGVLLSCCGRGVRQAEALTVALTKLLGAGARMWDLPVLTEKYAGGLRVDDDGS